MNNLQIVYGYEYSEEIKKLFEEYTQMLIKNEKNFEKYLDIQNYDDEINNLKKKYGINEGGLYLAFYEGEPAGCIALRRINETDCEMKRLYVRPEYRNKGIGKILVKKIIEDGKSLGYKSMYLDTLPFLKAAIKMYKENGFYEIGKYNDSPLEDTVYMKKEL